MFSTIKEVIIEKSRKLQKNVFLINSPSGKCVAKCVAAENSREYFQKAKIYCSATGTTFRNSTTV